MALIQCENISIAYEGQTVIEDLSFQMNQGDYLCIVGENGSGKSTLVKSLLGLKSPSKGKLFSEMDCFKEKSGTFHSKMMCRRISRQACMK